MGIGTYCTKQFTRFKSETLNKDKFIKMMRLHQFELLTPTVFVILVALKSVVVLGFYGSMPCRVACPFTLIHNSATSGLAVHNASKLFGSHKANPSSDDHFN